jgi:hypothetical protein
MQKRMTITMDEVVYEGLIRVVGRRKISAFLEDLARPHVVSDDLARATARWRTIRPGSRRRWPGARP